MDLKLSEILMKNLSKYSDFSDMKINEHGWVITKFVQVDKSVSFRLYNASQQEIKNLGKKLGLTIQEDYLNGNRIFRLVRGNASQECLIEYFKIIHYVPDKSIIKKEFDSIELIKKETHWKKNPNRIYTAIKDSAPIFIIYDHGVHEMLVFNIGSEFKIDESGNFIIFNKTQTTSRDV